MNKQIRIVGFHGPMGSGKSTAISLLDSSLPVKLELVKFAQPLYDMQEMIYNRINSVYVRPPEFVKDRKLLQWIGTEWGRGLNENLWVDLWKAEVSSILGLGSYNGVGHAMDYSPLIVCDDVRFENEAETIRAMGGVVIKINTQKNLDRITTANGIKNHSSEVSLPNNLVDLTVDNNGTLEQYQSNLKQAFKELKLI